MSAPEALAGAVAWCMAEFKCPWWYDYSYQCDKACGMTPGAFYFEQYAFECWEEFFEKEAVKAAGKGDK